MIVLRIFMRELYVRSLVYSVLVRRMEMVLPISSCTTLNPNASAKTISNRVYEIKISNHETFRTFHHNSIRVSPLLYRL